MQLLKKSPKLLVEQWHYHHNMKNFEIKNSKFGNGLFANRDINKGEVIFGVNDGTGKLYEFSSVYELPENEINHAIQVGDNRWVGHPVGRNINHSCDPNCGVKDDIDIVAMRYIKEGEELFLDYSTIEDSDWEMKEDCRCGSLGCRKIIKGFRSLDKDKVDKYMKGRYISEWLIEKYKL